MLSEFRGKAMAAELTADIAPLVDGSEGVRLQLIGEIDISTVDRFRIALQELLVSQHDQVVIDATGVDFMDSTGLHALVDGKRLIHENGSTVVLVASPAVRRVLELIFPDPLFAARVDSMDEALAVLSQAQQ
ncbi:MAG TPA: STAS domain-containing protein [Acidimicrobiia bacterium]|jgi:anti-anti-sigma factor|nr:STAS domain-containing protein [Acidimicrobiia bacterium]